MNLAKKIALLITVVIIWGLVGFRLYNQFKPKQRHADFTPRNINEIARDSFSLQLNYNDPFLRIKSSKKVVNANQSIVTTKVNKPNTKEQVKKPKWPEIKYYGYAKKVENTVYLAISIDGENRIVSSKEFIENLQIISFSEDSIMVKRDKENKVFYAR